VNFSFGGRRDVKGEKKWMLLQKLSSKGSPQRGERYTYRGKFRGKGKGKSYRTLLKKKSQS